jgi:Peptidase family M3
VGKDGGAMCTGIQGDESRILANYLPVFGWTSILAHELGHAYHNFVIVERKRTFLQASPDFGPTTMPLSLAETASTICETIVLHGARAAAMSPAEELALLEEELQSLTLNTFGIMPLFEFERAVFATRAQRDLSPPELEACMATAWRDVAGDAVDSDTVWSMSWTMGHFFIDNLLFYNFPYAFGALLALGLLTSREAEPEGFLDRFDTLLADSGMREANELAADFGIDLGDPAFWRASLDTFRAGVDRYDSLSQLIAGPNGDRTDLAPTRVSATKSDSGPQASLRSAGPVAPRDRTRTESPLTTGDVDQKMNEGRGRGPLTSSNCGWCSWNPAVLVPAMHQILRRCCHAAARCGVFAVLSRYWLPHPPLAVPRPPRR